MYKNGYFPIQIHIFKDVYFFANIQWLLYKYFHKERTIPCGRTKKDKYLCCCQPMRKERVYLSEDKHECFCKVCHQTRVLTNQILNEDNPFGWEETYD